MPTGRSCGVGLWKALRVSATKIATKAALATMKPASARYWAGCLRPPPACLAATLASPEMPTVVGTTLGTALSFVNKCWPTHVVIG